MKSPEFVRPTRRAKVGVAPEATLRYVELLLLTKFLRFGPWILPFVSHLHYIYGNDSLSCVRRDRRLRKRTRRSDRKTGANSKSKTSALPQRWELFGPPNLLDGEDAAAYDQLLARVSAAIKPVDVIDEMLINDIVSLEAEVLRWRRLKWSLIRGLRREALERYLHEHVEYFSDDFAEFLRSLLPEDQADAAGDMAYKCFTDEPGAARRIEELVGKDIDKIITDGTKRKVEVLLQEYARGEPDAVKQVNELLAGGGESLDGLTAEALTRQGFSRDPDQLNHIERIDRLITIAESRRNNTLREIDRRRAVLGAALRRNVQEIENTEYKLIEATPRGKNAH